MMGPTTRETARTIKKPFERHIISQKTSAEDLFQCCRGQFYSFPLFYSFTVINTSVVGEATQMIPTYQKDQLAGQCCYHHFWELISLMTQHLF